MTSERKDAMGRVQLEPLLPEHAAEMYQGLQNQEIYRFIDERPPLSEAALRERYERLALRRSPDGRYEWLNWVVRLLPSGRIVGFVQATISASNHCEIAYVVFPDVWGRGYGKSAVKEMLRVIEQGRSNICYLARVDAHNSRSISLLKSLGFSLRADDSTAQRGSSEELYELSRLSTTA
jgi:ribosomal-protein-alanine N-acetyltransferase